MQTQYGTRIVCRALLAAGLSVASAATVAAETAPGPRGAWLGVWSADAVDGGAQILAVVRGGPAEQAGLRGGDVVVELEGRPVASEADLGRVLRELAPGATARLAVLRGGDRVELAAHLGQPGRRAHLAAPPLPDVPEAPRPPGSQVVRAGLQIADIGPALRAHFGAPADAGVLVTRVEDASPAAAAGIVVGDVLVRIADTPIRSEREVRSNLVRWTATDPVRLEIVRSGEPQVLLLAPERRSNRAEREAAPSSERILEAEIERLERRLEELRRELERMHAADASQRR